MSTTEERTMETMKETIRRAAAQIAEDQMKAVLPSRVGRFITARQMAMKSHRLSKDGMTTSATDGGVWKWSNHFNIWACVEVRR